MKEFKSIISGAFALLFTLTFISCQEQEVKKVTLPSTKIAGEYIVDFELTQPFAASSTETLRIFNTSDMDNSLWVEDHDFFESQVKVTWDGGNTFSVENGNDILNGEIVNITGTIFPEKDSIHIEWRYLQGGDPADDYVVVANGVLYNGLTN